MVSLNPFSPQNAERIAKYYVLSVAITIIAIIILVIVTMSGVISNTSPSIQWAIGVVVMLSSTIALLSSYESWVGCKVVGEEYT